MPPFATHEYALRGLSRELLVRILRFLMLGWRPDVIASECRVHFVTVYRMRSNLAMYGGPRAPQLRRLGRTRRLTVADEEALLENLLVEGWRLQDEMAFWLYCERGVLVHRSTVSRLLKRRKWTPKVLQRLARDRSEAGRTLWKLEMGRFAAEDLVFLDESIFNEKTGWRYRAYGPIGQAIRYPNNVQRGPTWSIVAATSIDGWLPCTGVKKSYFKTYDLLNWLRTSLLPALRIDDGRPRVIILDNCSTHIDEAIINAIEAEGHIVRFLPPTPQTSTR